MANLPAWHPPQRPPRQAMSAADFQAGFGSGPTFDESTYLELKTGVGQKKIAEAIVAFSNAAGGNLLVGVDDDGNVVGRPHAGGLSAEDALHEAVVTVRNPGRYHIYSIDVDDKLVIVLGIEPRLEGFTQTPDGRVLQRRGRRNVPLYNSELGCFISRRLRQPFETASSRVALDQAGGELIDEVADAYRWNPSKTNVLDRLVELNLAEGDHSPNLTVAGSLVLLQDPTISVPKAYVEIFR